ncbi:MAG: glutamine synthetase family protein [Thermoprotei archaeon]|jgi:glutamine synthetase
MPTNNKEIYKETINRLEKHGIKYLRVAAVDLAGQLRVVTIHKSSLNEVIYEGAGIDGSSVPGFTEIEESDLVIKPDLNTLVIAPWDSPNVAWVIGDLYKYNGEPFEKNPRFVLKNVLNNVKKLGLKILMGVELEFFLIAGPQPKPLDDGYYYSAEPTRIGDELCRKMGELFDTYNVVKHHHEVAPGQYEFTLEASDPLTIADRLFLVKTAFKFMAKERGITATFMPKPFWGINGSGAHIHMSLWRGNKNLFYEGAEKVSKAAINFASGVLDHARALSAIVAPIVNSYKRLVPGYEAPVYIAWAYGNRSAIIRVPAHLVKSKTEAHIEYRHPDPSINPYLALSSIITAGIDGINRKLESQPINVNLYHLSNTEREKLGVKALPTNLAEAIEDLTRDPLIKSTLGEPLYESIVNLKKREYDDYISSVGSWDSTKYTITEWEYKHYLNI